MYAAQVLDWRRSNKYAVQTIKKIHQIDYGNFFSFSLKDMKWGLTCIKQDFWALVLWAEIGFKGVAESNISIWLFSIYSLVLQQIEPAMYFRLF